MIKKNTHLIVLGFIILVVFKAWFLPGLLSAGDFWFYYPSMYSQFDLFMSSWSWISGYGLGSPSVLYQAVNLSFGIPVFMFGRLMGLNWELVEKFGFFYPFLILGIFSSYYFSKKILSDISSSFYHVISVLVFVLNSYILTVVAGGQMLIALAYALSPLVVFRFFKVINQEKSFFLKNSIIAGLLLGAQMLLDLRVAYVSIVGIGLLFLIFARFNNIGLIYRKIKYVLFIPFGLAALINAFWIIPLFFLGSNPLDQLGSAYNTVDALKFFSFSKFEESISLLHPNWPENIFGKTYFMRPEFLLIPLIAFSSLLFIKRKTTKLILFFVLLALLGAFLGKGSNEPFGFIYIWLFENFPGFVMFRDPTKWYLLTALSYSILIPFAVNNVSMKFKSQFFKKINFSGVVLSLVFVYLLLLIRSALFGEINGILKKTVQPVEYQKLESFLTEQKEFSRILWLPSVQRFGYYSNNHPPISAESFFKQNGSESIVRKISDPRTQKTLQNIGVKYVIVPYDSLGEIFIEDRKYSPKLYKKTLDAIGEIGYLKEIEGFGRIRVFEINNPKDHFWSLSEKLNLAYKYLNPARYELSIKDAKKGDQVIFVENYDPRWVARNSDFKIQSVKAENNLNSFVLPEDGHISLGVYYEPQKWVNIGMMVSVIALFLSAGFLLIKNKK